MVKKSILISSLHHKELKKLSEAFGLNFYKLVEEMIIYFKKTGINPTAPKNENPSQLIMETDKRIISFFKVQERDILKPLRQEVYNYSKEQNERNKIAYANLIDKVETLNKKVEALNRNEIIRKEEIIDQMKKHQEGIIAIAELIDAKNKSGIVNRIKKTFE